MLSVSIDSRRAFRDPSEPTSQTLHLQRPGREWAGAVGRKHHIYIDQQENPHLGLVLVSVVVSIPTCHAGDRGSRRGGPGAYFKCVPAAVSTNLKISALPLHKLPTWGTPTLGT